MISEGRQDCPRWQAHAPYWVLTELAVHLENKVRFNVRVVLPFDIENKTDNLVNTSSVSKKTGFSWKKVRKTSSPYPVPQTPPSLVSVNRMLSLCTTQIGAAALSWSTNSSKGAKRRNCHRHAYTQNVSPLSRLNGGCREWIHKCRIEIMIYQGRVARLCSIQ